MRLNFRCIRTPALCIACLFALVFFFIIKDKNINVNKNSFIERYNSIEADKFVKAYTSGDINVMKRGLIRDWCVACVMLDECNNKKAYLAGMVFASERLIRLCKAQGNDNEVKFWEHFRNNNLSGLDNLSLPELIKAVDLLDAEMGVDFNQPSTYTNISLYKIESNENGSFDYPVF